MSGWHYYVFSPGLLRTGPRPQFGPGPYTGACWRIMPFFAALLLMASLLCVGSFLYGVGLAFALILAISTRRRPPPSIAVDSALLESTVLAADKNVSFALHEFRSTFSRVL